jgi:hypothetical protein
MINELEIMKEGSDHGLVEGITPEEQMQAMESSGQDSQCHGGHG